MATTEIQPGTYRIISGIAGTAVQVQDRNPPEVVAWELHEGENQQWFVQRSGDGYTFKNRRHNLYLATPSSEEHSRLCASRYPVTWKLLKVNDCYNIQFSNCTRALDLHCGMKTNGNMIHLFCLETHGHGNFKTWKFQHLSDETSEVQENVLREENTRLRQNLTTQAELLADKERQLSEQRGLASQLEGSVRQLQEIIKAKNETLAYAHRSQEETSRLREQQTQLQNEIAGLQVKVDRLEYLVQCTPAATTSRFGAQPATASSTFKFGETNGATPAAATCTGSGFQSDATKPTATISASTPFGAPSTTTPTTATNEGSTFGAGTAANANNGVAASPATPSKLLFTLGAAASPVLGTRQISTSKRVQHAMSKPPQ